MADLLEIEYAHHLAALAGAAVTPDFNAILRFAQATRLACRTDLGIELLARCIARAPEHPELAFAHAQLRYESGLNATAQFERLLQDTPGDLRLVAATASAYAAERRIDRADTLLSEALSSHPDWLNGHKSLAALRWASGVTLGDCVQSFASASAARPSNRGLRLAWFQTVVQAKDWAAAECIIADGERHDGQHISYMLAKLYLASESGDEACARTLFAETRTLRDPGLELCRMRFGLRIGDLDMAEAAAERLLGTAAAANAWPYLSLIWRLKNNPRARWLDSPDDTIKAYDVDLSAAELHELAQLLRSLHTARGPCLGQSVRGGTQTDRPLFFRHEPIIRRVKRKIVAAISDYMAALPPRDASHPLHFHPRHADVRFAGSWSVRLAPQGFHVAHTHPMGRISSSFYVSLPPPAALGAPPAGWINFGTAPPELGLGLAPYTRIEPKVGRLVLFPSTMWHATEPFDAGERLVIAFDVARPV